jgi:uncharacterized membrane protein YedE/YeeE
MKILLLALIVFMTVGVTLSASLLESFGVEKNYLLICLGAIAITGMVAFRGIALIIIIALLSLAINMPDDFLRQYYIDRDALMVLVILMVVFPIAYREFVGKK